MYSTLYIPRRRGHQRNYIGMKTLTCTLFPHRFFHVAPRLRHKTSSLLFLIMPPLHNKTRHINTLYTNIKMINFNNYYLPSIRMGGYKLII
jgi:hypothetical protein